MKAPLQRNMGFGPKPPPQRHDFGCNTKAPSLPSDLQNPLLSPRLLLSFSPSPSLMVPPFWQAPRTVGESLYETFYKLHRSTEAGSAARPCCTQASFHQCQKVARITHLKRVPLPMVFLTLQAQDGGHWPHVAIEHLKHSFCKLRCAVNMKYTQFEGTAQKNVNISFVFLY